MSLGVVEEVKTVEQAFMILSLGDFVLHNSLASGVHCRDRELYRLSGI